jgi:hypothetical protein
VRAIFGFGAIGHISCPPLLAVQQREIQCVSPKNESAQIRPATAAIFFFLPRRSCTLRRSLTLFVRNPSGGKNARDMHLHAAVVLTPLDAGRTVLMTIG